MFLKNTSARNEKIFCGDKKRKLSAIFIIVLLVVFALLVSRRLLLKPRQEPVVVNLLCGDGICDANEQKNASLCFMDCAAKTKKTLYVLWTIHIEGGPQNQKINDPECYYPGYQEAPGPKQYFVNFERDAQGLEELQREAEKHIDSFGGNPKMHITPAGEFFETEMDPQYGNRVFRKYNWLELGHEIGIQSHAIYWSGKRFCWPRREESRKGLVDKMTTLHYWAEKWKYNGKKVNHGITYTPGVKNEKIIFNNDNARTEKFLDRQAAKLGYRVSFEDWDGCVEDKPVRGRAPYLYKAVYDDGTEMYKVTFQGAPDTTCENPPRCSRPEGEIQWINNVIKLMSNDNNPKHLYYYAFATHAGSFNAGALGHPSGEWEGTKLILEYFDRLAEQGFNIKYITPKDFILLYEKRNLD